jgi:hypothetical protein
MRVILTLSRVALTPCYFMYSFAVHERVSVSRVASDVMLEVHQELQNTNLFLIALMAPLVLMVAINLISIRSFWDCHTGWLGGTLHKPHCLFKL